LKPPIDLVVLGGYLGAGKTTIANRLLAQPHGRRIAVLVNDFGAVNIDARLVRARHDDVIELDNGCICCTIGGSLIEALTRLEERTERPDVLLIEASGVSDPANIAQIGLLNRAFRLSAVLVAADATALADTLADPLVGAIAQRQLDGASAVLVTKLDLLGANERAVAMEWIRLHSPTDIVVATQDGEVPWMLAFDLPGDAGAHVAEDTGALERRRRPINGHWIPIAAPAFTSVAIPVPDVLDKLRFKQWMKQLPRTVLRAKGLVRLSSTDSSGADVDGGSLLLCQMAARRLRLTPFDAVVSDEDVNGILVFVGVFDSATESTLRAGLAKLSIGG